MALQRAFIWTQWVSVSDGWMARVVQDYPHVVDYDTWDRVGGLVAFEDETTGLIRMGWRAAPTHVATAGVQRWADRTGGQVIPPTPNVLMGEALADETVFAAMATTFVGAGDKSGLAIPLWRTYVDEGQGSTSFEPTDPFTQQEINLISDWLNANGISNAGFVAFMNEQLGTSMTIQEVSTWMQTHPRQQFTNIVAAVWRDYN